MFQTTVGDGIVENSWNPKWTFYLKIDYFLLFESECIPNRFWAILNHIRSVSEWFPAVWDLSPPPEQAELWKSMKNHQIPCRIPYGQMMDFNREIHTGFSKNDDIWKMVSRWNRINLNGEDFFITSKMVGIEYGGSRSPEDRKINLPKIRA